MFPKDLLSSYSVQNPESLNDDEKRGKVIATLELRAEVINAEYHPAFLRSSLGLSQRQL